MAYKHHGFWQCMDTKRDKDFLENLWQEGNAPWRRKSEDLSACRSQLLVKQKNKCHECPRS